MHVVEELEPIRASLEADPVYVEQTVGPGRSGSHRVVSLLSAVIAAGVAGPLLFGAGLMAGAHRESMNRSVPPRSAPVDIAPAGNPVVVEEGTNVVRVVRLRLGGDFTLDVPHRIVESWADTLVSSDPEVAQVLDDTTVRTKRIGTATLSIASDVMSNGKPDGTELYRVIVEK
jgi:hypothetical protein